MLHCTTTDDGRIGAHRLLTATATLLLSVAAVVGSAQANGAPVVSIGREGEAYTVEAHFDVPHPAALVLEVLTDYDGIPRFMPDIKKSVVRHRYERYAIVEQEAVSRVMMFSKRVHLRLAVVERPDSVRFRDELGTSFSRYEGVWNLAESAGRTRVTYHLVAQPSFGVPAFLVRRLLSRDAQEMIERLRSEMAARASAR